MPAVTSISIQLANYSARKNLNNTGCIADGSVLSRDLTVKSFRDRRFDNLSFLRNVSDEKDIYNKYANNYHAFVYKYFQSFHQLIILNYKKNIYICIVLFCKNYEEKKA